jgi:hypothetical protein
MFGSTEPRCLYYSQSITNNMEDGHQTPYAKRVIKCLEEVCHLFMHHSQCMAIHHALERVATLLLPTTKELVLFNVLPKANNVRLRLPDQGIGTHDSRVFSDGG